MAAHRAGIKLVILPERKRGDAEQLPAAVRKKLKIHFASHVDDVLAIALNKKKSELASRLLQPMPEPSPLAVAAQARG